MSQSRMLAHNNNNNVGSERNSNGSDDDDSTPLSTLTKGDMKVMMNRMMKCMLQSEIKTMVRNNRSFSECDAPPFIQLNILTRIAQETESQFVAVVIFMSTNEKEACAKAQGKWANNGLKQVRPAKGSNRLNEGKCLSQVVEATHATDGQVAGATHAVAKLLRHFASAPLFIILLVPLPSEVAEGKRKPKQKQLSCGGSTCDGQIVEALYLNAAISSIVGTAAIPSIGRRKPKQRSTCSTQVAEVFCQRRRFYHLNLPWETTASATTAATTNMWREHPIKALKFINLALIAGPKTYWLELIAGPEIPVYCGDSVKMGAGQPECKGLPFHYLGHELALVAQTGLRKPPWAWY
ncbi:hypothetical protein CsSME_00006877 [Camellia sinensis var. sinensis]